MRASRKRIYAAALIALMSPLPVLAAEVQDLSSPSADSSYVPTGHISKFRTIDLPEYQCKFRFTHRYQRQGGTPSYTMVGEDNPHGQYLFMCLSMPPHVNVSPLLLKPLMEKMLGAMLPKNKIEQKEKPIKLSGCQGLEYEVADQKDSMKVRAYCSGRRIYIVGLMGTKPYLASVISDQFFDSFQITR